MKTIIRILAVTATSLLFICADAKNFGRQITMTTGEDSLKMLQANYPAIYQNLIREFKNVETVKYTAEGNTLYVVLNNKINAVFSSDGKRRYAVTDLGAALPKNIAAMIKTEYPGHSVFYNREIKTNHEVIYQVIIENKHEYRIINFLNEEMEEQKKIKKNL